MCWKQEWAHAINNLQNAIEHIKRAQDKLEKRMERNESALDKSHEQMKVLSRIRTNHAGIEQCKGIITELKERQDELFKMIHQYGISKSEDPKRVYALMGKYKPPIDLASKKVLK